MVTCKVDTVAVPKMNSVRTRKPSSSNSSGFRLLDGDQLEAASSVSRNSVYKLKIDLMFDDTRSVRSNRLDDPRGSHRTRSIIMYGRSELASTAAASSRSVTSILQDTSDPAKIAAESTKKDVRRISNSVQAQIEQLFTDVAKDATSSFAVTCLGSLPLKDKVTSLQGLQEPLRELYLNELANEKRESGYLDICATGLRVKINANTADCGRVSSSNKNNNNNNNIMSNSNKSNNNCSNNNNNRNNNNNSNSSNHNSNNNNNNKNSNNNNNNDNNNNSNNSNNNNNNICSGSGNNSVTTPNNNNNNNSSNTTNNNNNNSTSDGNITPFHNIAVWSAVKFVLSEEDGGAAFLPLITDPENIDKSTLFQPLSPSEHKSVANSTHAPIFAVVMRAPGIPKLLECHGFICKSTEDAIVIAATLYQSLMAHVNANSQRNTKRRTPRQQNGVSCISIASSSAQTGSNYLSRSQIVSSGRKSSFRSSTGSRPSFSGSIGVGGSSGSPGAMPAVTRSVRKKRVSNSSLSSSSNVINEAVETTTEERKRRSHKTKRAPPVPMPTAATTGGTVATPISLHNGSKHAAKDIHAGNLSVRSSGRQPTTQHSYQHSGHHHSKSRNCVDTVYRASEMLGGGAAAAVVAAAAASGSGGVGVGIRNESNGDILTRVAIPRSGSFLNTGGLTRYKSRAARRHTDKLGGGHGGGGGSPLGFSELFNEFRLHENLHSLDDILYAIIDADGMSFNDLKPIYKEFLLKLAVTLTKDELYQRSKNIMRRQKKKKLKRRTSNAGSQKKPRTHIFGTKSLKKVFQLGQFRSCRGKPPKPPRHKDQLIEKVGKSSKSAGAQLVIGPPTSTTKQQTQQQQQRSRVATSGSDVSVIRPENGFNGLNRNSSSGYVSCSECSYDSEACTCASADRCYCSLRQEQLNNKQRRKNELNAAMVRKAAKQNQQQAQTSSTPGSNRSGSNRSARASNNANHNSGSSRNNRHSLISCKSDEKCYCSMVEEEPADAALDDVEETSHTHSDTTWCDTDSCVSASKCYCKREERRSRNSDATYTREEQQQLQQAASRRRQSRSSYRKSGNDKLALDYELFTISGNGKSVQPHEALSMKKSVEAAAIFADVKLRQTTDIKSLCATAVAPTFMQAPSSRRSGSSSVSKGSSKLQYHSGGSKRRESQSTDRRNERNILTTLSSSCNSSQKSYSAEDLLSKLTAIEEVVGCASSIRSSAGKQREIHQFSFREKHFQNNYQSMKAVSASLEDTLGYLP